MNPALRTMSFILQNDTPNNDTFLLTDGRPIFRVETPGRNLSGQPTVVRRVDYGTFDVAKIQPLGWGRSSVLVRGNDITPTRSDALCRHESFLGSDGRPYKWKIGGIDDPPTLVKNDASQAVIAMYNAKPRQAPSINPATLNVSGDGFHMLDDIIATFVYVEHRRRETIRQSFVATPSPPSTAPYGSPSLS